MSPQVLITLLHDDAVVPTYAHPGDAGTDLTAVCKVELPPGGRAAVPTGIAIALPDGFAAFIHPRSGLAIKRGVTVINAPGTIDAGYRGEILVPLHNTNSDESVVIHKGDRIAQLVIQEVAKAQFMLAERLPGSARGGSGFGSSGR